MDNQWWSTSDSAVEIYTTYLMLPWRREANAPVPAQNPECWTWIPRAGLSFLFVSFSCGETKRELLHLYNQVAKPAHLNQIKLPSAAAQLQTKDQTTSALQVKGQRDAVLASDETGLYHCDVMGQVTRDTHLHTSLCPVRCFCLDEVWRPYWCAFSPFSGLWFFSVPALILHVCCSSSSVWTGLKKNLVQILCPSFIFFCFCVYALKCFRGFQHSGTMAYIFTCVHISGSLFHPQNNKIKKLILIFTIFSFCNSVVFLAILSHKSVFFSCYSEK